MCNQFTLHHEFRIDTRRTNFEQKTDSNLHVCDPMNKEHEDPNNNNLEAPRLAWYKQKEWGRHQDTVYWVNIKPAQQKRIQVLSNKIERNHPLRHTPSLLYPESYHDEIWRSHVRESICVTSTSSKDFL